MKTLLLKIVLRLIASLFIYVFLLFIGFVYYIAMSLSGYDGKALPHLFFAFFIALTGLLFTFNLKFRWGNIVCATAVGLCVIGAVIQSGMMVYRNRIPVLADGQIALQYYQPFDNSGTLAVLPAKASLQLDDSLPRLDGATALYPLYAAFVQATYPSNSYPLNDGMVGCHKSAEAFQNLLDGHADIIFCAAPSAEQQRMTDEQQVQFQLTPIGREAFVFFVNRKNPLDALTSDDIRNIYSGQTTTWREIGGGRGSIRPFQRDQNSGSQSALERLMGNTPLMAPLKENRVDGMGGIIKHTANYKNYADAIGFSFLYYTTRMVKDNQIKLLAIDGVYPTTDSIRDGSYPYADDFYAITLGNESPQTRSLIDWICSDEGQSLVEQTGYVPLTVAGTITPE